jgi:two-component system sensor histidine kinase PilS (NtrC family)
MPSQDAQRVSADPDLAWRVLGLLNLFRLLVASVLSTMSALLPGSRLLGSTWPFGFVTTTVAMFAAGVGFIVLLKSRVPSLRMQAYLQVAFDILAVGFLLYSSGGVQSGLGLLLIVPVGAISLLVANRTAFLLAALASLTVLAQQVALMLLDRTDTGAFTQAGLLGGVVFIVALAAAPLANRLRESEALVRQRELDLANLAELSQFVIEKLRESIVVVDEHDGIRLINESARRILAPPASAPVGLLGELSPRLLYLLATWRRSPGAPQAGTGTLLAADGTREIQPHFAPLGERWPCPVIIFLEDLSAQSARVRQSKLAALGRLSASIAHEIRNPVGAMSHAAQLLEEAEGLAAPDRRLVDIIKSNATRVSGIIENIMQLSRREATRAERMPLKEWLEDFVTEFLATGELSERRFRIDLPEEEVEVRIDPSHLHQIVWNLAENALKYGHTGPDDAIEIRIGRLPGSTRPFLEVADRGPGIDPAAAERIFEPFFTSQAGGTGLGLFISRELAQGNGALLAYEPRPGGGSLFRLVFADPLRWEETLTQVPA